MTTDDAALVAERVRNRIRVRDEEYMAAVEVVDLHSLLALADEAIAARAELARLRRVAWGVVHNVPHISARRFEKLSLWSLVGDVAALGSTSAAALCREYGRDPNLHVRDSRRVRAALDADAARGKA